jgi:hypothetical protein
MDFFTKREWEAQLGPDPPTVETLKSFLQKKMRNFGIAQRSRATERKNQQRDAQIK